MQTVLNGKRKNANMLSDLRENSSDQCRTRIKNLKQSYLACKDNNRRSGRARKTFQFYKEFDTVLGLHPSVEPLAILETVCLESPEPEDSAADDDGNFITCGQSVIGKCVHGRLP